MMSTPVKSAEPSERSREAPEHARAHAPTPVAAQGLKRFAGVQRHAGNLAVQRLLRSGALRAKLAVGRPGDEYEQEADRVAERVVSAPAVTVQRKCACGGGAAGECEECRAGAQGVQRKAAVKGPHAVSSSSSSPSADRSALGVGGGSPLDSSSRAVMESRFGHDFGAVRV